MEPLPFDPSWLRPTTDREARGAVEGDLASDTALAIRCLDLTSLNGDDTAASVVETCDRAIDSAVAAVCVFPAFLGECRKRLEGSGVRVATVAAGFPHGLSPLASRVREVKECEGSGGDEIDVVIRREWALIGDWNELYRETTLMRQAAGTRTLKVILSTGELRNDETIYRTAMTAMMAGADFVKTSTGKEAVNATLEVGRVMAAAIREFRRRTGRLVGLKSAGGIREREDALAWVKLARDELGEEWLTPDRFRIGASSLLGRLVTR